MKIFLKDFAKIFPSAVLAGFAIGLGGCIYLNMMGLAGAVLFSFGLLTVVHYKLHLFTGKSGFFENWLGVLELFTYILIGNVLGCELIASMTAKPEICQNALLIVSGRLETGYFMNGVLAIPCGFIMTTAVEFGRRGKLLPLLFGVPLFILCGFRHSIADAYYYLVADLDSSVLNWELFFNWIAIVMGNFVGCNFYRILLGTYEE